MICLQSRTEDMREILAHIIICQKDLNPAKSTFRYVIYKQMTWQQAYEFLNYLLETIGLIWIP